MTKAAETEPATPKNLDNLPLKRWLLCAGPVRRCELQKKLKSDLQNFGLSRRQVHQGLLQLVTKPRVVLERDAVRRYASRPKRRLSVDNEEKDYIEISTECCADNSTLERDTQHEDKDISKPDSTVTNATEETECDTKSTHTRVSDIQRSVTPSKSHPRSNDTPTPLHPFEEALKQFDRFVKATSMYNYTKFASKRSSVIVLADTTSKSRNKDCANNRYPSASKKSACSEDQNQRTPVADPNDESMRKTPDLVSDRVGVSIDPVPFKDKKHQIKLNFLNPCIRSSNKKADTPKTIHSKVGVKEKTEADSMSTKIRWSSEEKDRSRVTSQNIPPKTRIAHDAKVAKKEGSAQKRRSPEKINSDYQCKRNKIVASPSELKTSKEKKKKLKVKFRKYFGDSTSISEDEEERNILCERLKRRSKKDSVDSCDSGVCTTESNVNNCVEILKEYQKAVPDSTVQEDLDEGATKKTSADVEARDVTKDKSIETVDQVKDIECVTIDEEEEAIVKTEIVEDVDSEAENVESIRNFIEAGNATKTTESVKDESTANVGNIKTEVAKAVEDVAEVGTAKPATVAIDTTESDASNTVIDQTVTECLVQEKSTDTSDGSNCVGIVTITVTPTPETERSEVKTPTMNIEVGNAQIVTEESSKSQPTTNEPDIDWDELLEMALEESYITSNGNVISIQEKIVKDKENTSKEDIDGNSNLKVTQPENNENLQRKEACDTSNRVTESVLLEAKESNVVQEDTQPIKVPPLKLRVLSSAELGSRWCPTPVSPAIIPQSSCNATTQQNSFSQTVITTAAAAAVDVVTTTSSILSNILTQTPTTPLVSEQTTMSPQNIVLLNYLSEIYNIIVGMRMATKPLKTNVNYLLALEFTKLCRLFTTRGSYITIIQKVIDKFNMSLFAAQPLSCEELFQYSPYLRHICLKEWNRAAVNNTTCSQAMYPNTQHVYTPSVQTEAQHSVPVSVIQSQCPPNSNRTPAGVNPMQQQQQQQQTLQETVVLQLQNNVQQNVSTNPMANPQCNAQQPSCRMEMQRLPPQQKTPRPHVPKPRLKNMYSMQRVLVEPVRITSVPTDQLRKQPYVPTTNPSFANQQFTQQQCNQQQCNQQQSAQQQTIYTTAQANTFMTNGTIQQNTVQANQQQSFNLSYLLQQQNLNFSPVNQQQSAHLIHRIPQQTNPTYVAQQQNIQAKVQQPYINPAHITQQQNIHPVNTMQQQNINSLAQMVQQQRIQQQNIISAQRMQQQNINPQRMQQPNINLAQRMQQANASLGQRIQQENINPTQGIRKKSKKVDQRLQQQNLNSAQRLQQQNINTTPRIQQQNHNIAYIHQQVSNPPHSINPGCQDFQKIVIGNVTYDLTQGTVKPQSMPHLSQNAQQSVPIANHRTQPAQNVFVKNAAQVPKIIQQNEQAYQIPLQAKLKMPPPPYIQTVHTSNVKPPPYPEKKSGNSALISLESRIKQFSILKYLTDIQKLMLRQHLDFYLSCTTWLEQEVTQERWNEIESERQMLFSFQTLVKHIVDKTIRDLQSKCQENMIDGNLCMDIKLNASKQQLYIIVEEKNGVHCQVKVSGPQKVQPEIIHTQQAIGTSQENKDTEQEQLKKQQEATSKSQNGQLSDQMHQPKIHLQKEEIKEKPNVESLPKNELKDDAAPEADNKSEAVLVSKTPTPGNNEPVTPSDVTKITNETQTSNIIESVEQNSHSTNLRDTNTEETVLTEPQDIVQNTVQSSPKGAAVSHLKEPKDTVQLQSTQLVTVEISPNNDQVKVIDVSTACETEGAVIKTETDKLEESKHNVEELFTCTSPSIEETTGCEPYLESNPNSPEDDIKYSNEINVVVNNLMEEDLDSHIADVRSISLEAFENIAGSNNDQCAMIAEEYIEEEIKICLRCNKPSTVACSICLEAKYCSKECSDLHWRDEHHKYCVPIEKNLYLT